MGTVSCHGPSFSESPATPVNSSIPTYPPPGAHSRSGVKCHSDSHHRPHRRGGPCIRRPLARGINTPGEGRAIILKCGFALCTDCEPLSSIVLFGQWMKGVRSEEHTSELQSLMR